METWTDLSECDNIKKYSKKFDQLTLGSLSGQGSNNRLLGFAEEPLAQPGVFPVYDETSIYVQASLALDQESLTDEMLQQFSPYVFDAEMIFVSGDVPKEGAIPENQAIAM